MSTVNSIRRGINRERAKIEEKPLPVAKADGPQLGEHPGLRARTRKYQFPKGEEGMPHESRTRQYRKKVGRK